MFIGYYLTYWTSSYETVTTNTVTGMDAFQQEGGRLKVGVGHETAVRDDRGELIGEYLAPDGDHADIWLGGKIAEMGQVVTIVLLKLICRRGYAAARDAGGSFEGGFWGMVEDWNGGDWMTDGMRWTYSLEGRKKRGL